MKGIIQLQMQQNFFSDILSHLAPGTSHTEEACFAFAKNKVKQNTYTFKVVDWLPLKKENFEHQFGDYLELESKTRAMIIKKAHDTKTSLVEFHSHPFPFPAAFSIADLNGLKEFVPHVWWRLKNRPYLAIVVSPTDFDALVWIDNPNNPIGLSRINVNNRFLKPTNITMMQGVKYGSKI